MRPPRLLVVGSANMDLVVQTERLPAPGETLLGGVFSPVRGGKGANQAVACSRLGAETWMLGRVGQDAFGDDLLAGLAENGVHTEYTQRDPDAPSGVALILVQASGENSIVVAPGANMQCTPEDLGRVPDLAYFEALLVQLEVPLALLEIALRTAREQDVLTILDAGPPTPEAARLISLADVISPNQTEAKALLGLAAEDEPEPAVAARELLARGAQQVVLKLGAEGALMADGERCEHLPAARVEPVDTTGAGDAFTAALAVSLARGHDLREATQVANLAGALACTVLGAQPSMPTGEAVSAFAAARGIPLS